MAQVREAGQKWGRVGWAVGETTPWPKPTMESILKKIRDLEPFYRMDVTEVPCIEFLKCIHADRLTDIKNHC